MRERKDLRLRVVRLRVARCAFVENFAFQDFPASAAEVKVRAGSESN
jgi:hypothetical protein